jgi:very-short-patch-repair endonuclease
VTVVERELARARQNLLDLTLRNRLLNHRPSRLRSIRVVGELPAEIYDALVLREKSLEFRGTGSRRRTNSEGIVDPDVAGSAQVHRTYETWSARTDDALEGKHTDRYLQTPYDEESLAKKLFRVYHEGRSAVEEQGYTVAHLAIGFLEWFESAESDQPRRAPLLLVPAELERVRAGDFSKVRWTGEDVVGNISLAAKLAEHGVALPPFEPPEEKGGIDAWLQKVAAAIAAKPRWRVLSELTLDFFSFTKFVMYRDLDPTAWPDGSRPHEHPLLQTLFEPAEAPRDDGFDVGRIDDFLTARDVWHVMDADPSQIAVIEDVKAGRNLVVQGPPGTGKSQTITNLIAELLAAGKTVLFVSEKMAALEVVKSRLDDAGLGPFCLELHSRKANKKSVLQELQRSLESRPLASIAADTLDAHELLKRDLNRYASELGTPIAAWQRTPFQLFGIRQAALSELGALPVEPLLIDHAAGVEEKDVVAAETALRDLGDIHPFVQPVASHPWRASTRDAMLPHQEEELRGRIARVVTALRAIEDAATAVAIATGATTPARLCEVERVVAIAELMRRPGAPTETAILLSAEWNAPNAMAEELVRRVEAFQNDRAALARTFHEAALEGSTWRELDEFAALSTRLFRFFSGRFRALRKALAALYRGAAPKPAVMVADLSRLVEHQSVRDALRADPRGRGCFGARWQADRSDCRALRDFATWIVAFRKALLAQSLTDKAVEVAARPIDPGAIAHSIEQLIAAAGAGREQVRALLTELRIDARDAFGCELEDAAFRTIAETAQRWQDQLPALFRWAQFNAARAALRSTVAAQIESLVLEERLEAGQLIPFFRASLAESLLRVAFAERGTLGQFVGELQEKKIARFRELDAGLVPLNRARLSQRLHSARPRISGGASPGSEVGILLGEIHRRRGHMAIRKLLTKARGVIQRIKPCFLMSPLSVAQFLDPRSARFDVVVFDEASQVRPEDAVGAMLRGAQLVVMGDAKQLPPTSFFDRIAADDSTDDDEDDAASVRDVESILEQCARSYPSRTLEWHYRSRHESLIAVSNVHFYENKLRIYPSPIDRADGIGLHFVHVPHGVYDRGGTGMNRVEAQVVAAAALEHFRRTPSKSLGVGTLNIQQQEAIQEAIEAELRAHPEMEEHFRRDRAEAFFVKNLETIQGDERDAILISLGFGRDADGKLSLNFGPINKDGGERRLNVLISRARERCVVYSNFRAHELSLDGTKSKGVFALRAFLEYAESRQLMTVEPDDDAAETALEQAVADALREKGWEVTRRVGRDASRVDVAVHDPLHRGRYLLGVLCDGPNYHHASVARDRDRLRVQILETLGWMLHRVWSTDWYRNRGETLARLLQAIETAKAAPRESVRPMPIPPVTIEIAPSVDVRNGEEDAQPYEMCRALRIPVTGELHDVPASTLAIAVEDVVAIEGPVHVDEVVRRIRTIWGLQRAGNRIRGAIDQAIAVAMRRGAIVRDGEFLRAPGAPIRVRRRNGDPPARIDLISDAEIAAAVEEVLRMQFSTPRDELIDAAARRLGIQTTTGPVAARIASLIDHPRDTLPPCPPSCSSSSPLPSELPSRSRGSSSG